MTAIKMKRDRRYNNKNEKEPSNVTMSSRYSFYPGDDKPEESINVKIGALQGKLLENTLIQYITDKRFKKEILLISSIK